MSIQNLKADKQLSILTQHTLLNMMSCRYRKTVFWN